MKQIFNYLAYCIIFIATTPPLTAQRFVCTPEKPMPGEPLTVQYDPSGTPLEDAPGFDATAFLFDPDNREPVAVEMTLTPDGDLLTGTLQTHANTKAVLFSFKNSEEEKVDHNDKKGYKTLFYMADRTTPVQGAYAAKAKIYSYYGHLGDVQRDMDKAYLLMKKELATYPASKLDFQFYSTYANLASKQNDGEALEEIKVEVDRLSANKKASETDLLNAAKLANAIGEKELATALGKRAEETFPDGEKAKSDLQAAFKQAGTPAEKTQIFQEGKQKYGGDKDMDRTFDSWASTIANEYAQNGDWENFDKYFTLIASRTRKAGLLNSLAWGMSGESLDGEAKDAKKGLELSGRSLQLIEKEMEQPSEMPIYYTPKRWKNDLAYTHAMYSDTYALLAYKSGDVKTALQYQLDACQKTKFKEGEMTERYSYFFEKTNSPAETESMLAQLIAEGKATSSMIDQHKRLYLANNTLESAYEKYRVSLEKEAKANLRKEMARKMIEDDAPDFRLVNLKGEEVSLEGLRGKVVVLDFWATWCGPCKASFPGMQRAVNKYADNEDVVFLFIDTWERGEEKAKNAAEFIASKEYTFNVLMDDKDEVVQKYGVSGIPTKFVVDKKGKIRFISKGFGGNDEELVNELSLMIEMAGGSTPAGLTGAP